MKKKEFITKDDILFEYRCPKALYLNTYYPELKDDFTVGQQMIMDQGKEVGRLAWKLFEPENSIGIDASQSNKLWGRELISNTNAILDTDEKVVYEAGFMSKDEKLFCRTDILQRYADGFYFTEVKSSTKIKPPQQVLDIGFQYRVIMESGLKGKIKFNIGYVNRDYVRNGELNLLDYFVLEDVTRKAKDSQAWIDKALFSIEQVRKPDAKMPDVKVGKQCFDDRLCPFYGHCSKTLPENPIWNIGGMRKSTAHKIAEKGYISLEQIPEDTKLTEAQ